MSITQSLTSPTSIIFNKPKQHQYHNTRFLTHLQPLPSTISPLHASKKISIIPSSKLVFRGMLIGEALCQEGKGLAGDRPRNWARVYGIEDGGGIDDDEDYDDGDEEEERSLDLLVKFVHNVFKKVSKRARKAARSVLPASISTKLVRFSVDGVLVLAFLWVLKGFLEVVCTLGSAVFVSILLIRVIWSALIYLQESRIQKFNEIDDYHAWNGARPAT